MWQGLIAAAPLISAGSSLLGGVTSALGARSQMGTADAMGLQFDNNWKMYDRSLRRGPSIEMAGLKAAGINPLLRYGQHGAPLPHTAHGVSIAPPVNPLSGLAEGIAGMGSSAVDAMKAGAETKKTIQSTENLVAELDNLRAELPRIQADTALRGAQRDLALNEAQLAWVKKYTEWVNQDHVREQIGLTREQARRVQYEIDNLSASAVASRMGAALDNIRTELERLNLPQAKLDARIAEEFFFEAGALARGVLFGQSVKK